MTKTKKQKTKRIKKNGEQYQDCKRNKNRPCKFARWFNGAVHCELQANRVGKPTDVTVLKKCPAKKGDNKE